jgi:hypothetical protein
MQQWYSNKGMVFSVVCPVAVAMQQHCKHISAAKNPDTTIEDLFSVGMCQDVITGTF